MPNELYYLNVNDIDVKKASSLVSAERKKKADALKNESDKKLFLGGELLLKLIFKKYGIENGDLLVNDNGKPFLKSGKIKFNVSHSGEYAICAVSDYEIGCDIQKHGKLYLPVAEKYYTEEEYNLILSAESEKEKTNLFFDFWAKKESYLKNVGTGIKSLSSPQEIGYFFYRFKICSGYSCFACVRADNLSFKITEVKPDDLTE